MAKLYFRVQAEYDKVVKLREEIEKLQATIRKTDINKDPMGKDMGTKLKSLQKEYRSLTEEASRAGATIEKDFKTGIYKGSLAINDLTGKIINQKTVIKNIEADVDRLSERYKQLGKYSPQKMFMGAELGSAKRALKEEQSALFGLQTEQAKARLSTKQLRDEYALYKEDALASAKANFTLGKAFAVVGGAAMAQRFVSQLIDIRGQFRNIEVSLDTMVGKEKSKQLLAETKDYAVISPLNLKDISSSTQMMIGFNIEAEKVPRFIRAIGDVSQGNSQKFQSLSLAFSQCSAAGKLMGQDLNQMINAGFNPLSIMSEKTDKSMARLKKEMSDGAISAEMVQQAFIDATSAGGKFYNMSQNASKELSGQVSMFGDAVDNAFNKMGEQSEEVLIDIVQLGTRTVENYDMIGRSIMGLVGIYGTYRAALIVNTVIEQGANKAIWEKVIATRAAMVAQAAYNKILSLNPWVMASMAVVSLGVAFWTLADRTTAAEKAQEKFNQKQEDAKKLEGERKQHIESLIATIQEETTSSLDRVKAMDEIKKSYPTLFQKYIDEKGHIRDLIGLWKEYNEEESKRRVQQNKQNVADTQQKIKKTENRIKQLKDAGGEAGASRPIIRKLERELLVLRDELSKDEALVQEDALDQYKANLKAQTDKQIAIEREQIKRLQEWRKENQGKMSDSKVPLKYKSDLVFFDGKSDKELSSMLAALDAEQGLRKPEANYQEEFNSAKKAWEDAKKKLSEIEKDKARFTQKQYEEAKKLKETTEQKYKDLGGSTDKALAKEEKDFNKLSKEAAERGRQLKDLEVKEKFKAKQTELEISQGRIEGMAEGFDKEMAQIKLHYDQLILANEQRENEMLEELRNKREMEWKIKNPKADEKGLVFDRSSVTAADLSGENAQRLQEFTNIANAYKKKAEDDLLKSLLEKCQNYEQQRKEITQKYSEEESALQRQLWEAKTEEERKIYLTALDELDKKRKQAFANISKQEIEDSGIWRQLMGNVDGLPTDVLDKLLRDAEILVKAANMPATEMKAMMDTLNKARENLIARNPFKTLKEEYEKYRNAVKNGDKDGAATSWGNIEKANESIKSTIDTLGSSFANIGSIFSEEIGQTINDIASVSKSLVTVFQELGKDNPLESIAGSKDAIAAIVNIVATVGGTIFNLLDGTAEAQARNAEYQRRQEGYWKSINYQVERYIKLLEEAAGKDYYAASEAALKKLEDARNKAHKDIIPSMPGGNVDGVTFGLARLFNGKDLDGILGVITKEAQEIFDFINNNGGYSQENQLISEKALLAMKGNADIWSKLPDWMQEAIDKFVEYKDQSEELQQTLNKDLFQTTAKDIEDIIRNGLKGGKKSVEEFGEDITSILQDALLQSFVVDQLRGKAQEFYKKYTKLADSDNNGELDLTAEEIASLKQDWADIVKNAADENERINGILGIDPSSKQTASSGGFQTTSQETSSELNGRFTDIQMKAGELKAESIIQTMELKAISIKTDTLIASNYEIRNIADETRSILVNSYLELQQIRDNTGAVVKPIKQMASDMKEMKESIKKL